MLMANIFCYSIPATAQDSFTFGGDFERKRLNPDVCLPPSEPAWYNDNVSQSITQPVVIGNTIFHASARWMWQLPLADGSNGKEKKLFEIDLGETATTGSHPSFYKNVLYVGSKNGDVIAYDVIKKKVVQRRKVSGDYGVVSSPLVLEDTQGKINVIVGSSDSKAIYIFKNFNSSDSTKVERFEFKPFGDVTSSPSKVGSNVFVVGINHNSETRPGKISFFDINTKKELWSHTTADGIPSSVAVSQGMAFAGDKSGHFYALNFAKRSLAWSNYDFAGGGTFVNFSPAVADGKAFFPIRRTNKFGAKGNGILVAFNQFSGTRAWAATGITGEITTSPVVWSAGKIVLVGTSAGLIYGFDVDTGQPKGWFTLDGGKTMSAAGKLVGIGPGGIGGNIRPDGISTEMTIANGYLLVGGVRPDGRGRLVAFRLTGSDLALTGFTADKPVPQAGEQVGLAVTVVNCGDGSRQVTLNVRDNRTKFSRNVPLTVPAKGKFTAQVTGWQAPVGQVTLTASIISPPGGSKFNYLKTNDSKTLTLANGVDLAVGSLTTANPVFTGDSQTGSVTVENKSAAAVSTTVQFLLNNNPKAIPAKKVTLPPKGKTKVSFTWTAPATAGTACLKAIVNPSRNEPLETDFGNNTVSRTVTVRAQEVNLKNGQLTVSAKADPAKTMAGYGFTLTVHTKTTPYTWTETHTTVVNGKTVTKKVTRSRPCPGAAKVTAVFPTGESVRLEPASAPGTPENTWSLPPSSLSREHLRKHYIPPATPDGTYRVRITAEGAGDHKDLTAKTTVNVQVEGSMYDNIHSRITE